MYTKAAELTKTSKKSKQKPLAIKDRQGELLTEEKAIQARWKEYIEELYAADQKPDWQDMNLEEEDTVDIDSLGPSVLDCEIERAISELKNGKSPGIDGIPGELIKLLGDDAKLERYMQGHV